jgi:hypothetical protein
MMRRYEEERLYDEIPEAVVFFMSILPSSNFFNGNVAGPCAFQTG